MKKLTLLALVLSITPVLSSQAASCPAEITSLSNIFSGTTSKTNKAFSAFEAAKRTRNASLIQVATTALEAARDEVAIEVSNALNGALAVCPTTAVCKSAIVTHMNISMQSLQKFSDTGAALSAARDFGDQSLIDAATAVTESAQDDMMAKVSSSFGNAINSCK